MEGHIPSRDIDFKLMLLHFGLPTGESKYINFIKIKLIIKMINDFEVHADRKSVR